MGSPSLWTICICLLLSAPLARAACAHSHEAEVDSYATFSRRLLADAKLSALEKAWAARGLGPLPAGQNAYFLKQNITTRADILASLPKASVIPDGKKPPTAAQAAAAKKKRAKETARLQALKDKHAVKTKPLKGAPAKAPKKVAIKKSTRAPGKTWSFNKSAGGYKKKGGRIGGGTAGTIQCSKLTCLSDLSRLTSLSLSIPVQLPNGNKVDLGQVLKIDSIVQSFMTALGKGFCDLVFSGADISSGNFGSMLAVAQLGNLFALMPLEDTRNYLVGGIFAGMADPSSIASAGIAAGDVPAVTDLIGMGLAFAINPCTNDYVFQFIGLETPPIEMVVVEAVVAVDSFGWSSQAALSPNFIVDGDKMIDATFWVPGAPGDSVDFAASTIMEVTPAVPEVKKCVKTCKTKIWFTCIAYNPEVCTVTTPAVAAVTATVGGLPSKFYYQGHIDVQPIGAKAAKTAGQAAPVPPKDKAQIKVTGTAILFVNPDPLNNGATNGDFTMLMSVQAAPVLVLPSFEIPLDKFIGTATATMYMAYTNSFTLAARLEVQAGGGFAEMLKSFSFMPKAVADSVGTIFGGPVIKSVAVYAGADAWGIRLQLNGNGGSLAAIGAILDFLHTYVDSSIPNKVDPVFSISGPTSGNGLPIAIGLGLTNVGFQNFYFCASNGDCPGGSSCNLGLCMKISCPSGSHSTGPLSCWRDSCPNGYASPDILGVCWERCASGEVDIGTQCNSCPSSSKPQYDSGMCYEECRDGYYGAATMCLMRSCSDVYGSAYETWPLTCFRPYASYTKSCTYDKCSCNCCCKCSCRKVNNDCRDGYGDRGCFCAREADTKGRTYDRGVGSFPTARIKKTVTMATLPIVSFPS